MTLEFDSDVEEVKKFLLDAAARYAQAYIRMPEQAKQFKLLSAICLVYTCGAGAQVALHLDTREVYEPDGTWTNRNYAVLKKPKWASGNADDEEFATVVGENLKRALLASRDSGAFRELPRRNRCELAVEHINGLYGWPNYQDRGKENLI